MFFFALIAEKEQIQFAAVAVSNSLNENVKDISLDESKAIELNVIPDVIKETPSQADGITNIQEDIQTNDLLLAITPDGVCIGVKAKYGMPESFDTERDRNEWLKLAAEKAIDLKNQIESGACSVESVKDMIDTEPNLPTDVMEKLVAKNRSGSFSCFLNFVILHTHK